MEGGTTLAAEITSQAAEGAGGCRRRLRSRGRGLGGIKAGMWKGGGGAASPVMASLACAVGGCFDADDRKQSSPPHQAPPRFVLTWHLDPAIS